jgi:hypothetical protein
MGLGGSGAFIAPEDRAQIWRSPEQMPTIKADPSMSNVSINAQVERMTQPFWEYPNEAPGDLYQNVMSQLLALFRTQGCVLPVAEELAKKVTGELTARVREVLRRPGLAASWITGVIQVGDLTLDLERHMLWRGDDEIHLAPKEFDLLAFMMKNADALLTHVKLLRSVWGLEYGGELEYLRTYIWTLRKLKRIPPIPNTS